MRPKFAMSLLLVSALLMPGLSAAQPYPGKPVRFIVNSSVGSLADVMARASAFELSRQTGQPWVIENRAGGNFVIGANACKASAPDGYTVCLVNEQAMSMNPHLIPKLPYDPDRDFKPITNLYVQVSGVAVAASLPANSIAELVRLASSKAGSMNFATLGPGSSQDILRQWMNGRYKTGFVGVPYKGMPLILGGIVTGETTLSQTAVGAAGPYLAGGKLKLLAVNTSKRLSKLPEVQTFNEAGLGEFIDVHGRFWWGLVAPAAVPDPIVQRINAEFHKLFREPKFAELVENQFLDPVLGTPEQFAAFLKTDRERAANVVRTFNIPRQ